MAKSHFDFSGCTVDLHQYARTGFKSSAELLVGLGEVDCEICWSIPVAPFPRAAVMEHVHQHTIRIFTSPGASLSQGDAWSSATTLIVCSKCYHMNESGVCYTIHDAKLKSETNQATSEECN